MNNQKKGLGPKHPVIDGIFIIKGKSVLYIMVADYTNKHVTFNKAQCIGHMVLSIDNMSQTSVKSYLIFSRC